MNLIPWRNKREEGRERGEMTLPSLRHQIDDLFDRFLRDPFEELAETFTGRTGGLRTDLSETDDALIVRTELPGVDAGEVDVNVTGNTLTITGEKKEEHENEHRHYHYVERQYGSFHRSVPLPGYIDPNKVEAVFKNGVLTVTIAKQPEAKPRKIQVKGG